VPTKSLPKFQGPCFSFLKDSGILPPVLMIISLDSSSSPFLKVRSCPIRPTSLPSPTLSRPLFPLLSPPAPTSSKTSTPRSSPSQSQSQHQTSHPFHPQPPPPITPQLLIMGLPTTTMANSRTFQTFKCNIKEFLRIPGGYRGKSQ